MVKTNRELDVEVAKKVLKLNVWFDNVKNDWYCFHPNKPDHIVILPKYSTEPDYAYVIVKQLQNFGYFCNIGSNTENETIVWRATFYKTKKSQTPVSGDSLPQAICLAALALFDTSKPPKKSVGAELINSPKNKN